MPEPRPAPRFSAAVAASRESATHGAKAVADRRAGAVLDLGIGTLDEPADPRIDAAVAEFVRAEPAIVHAFAPVRGLPFVLEALAARLARMHGLEADPARELIVTPGGIKGALTLVFHAFLDPGDEVLVPTPNWPHYEDMIALHGARMVPVPAAPDLHAGLTAAALDAHLTDTTMLVVLGDCVNPTGKVYATAELAALAAVVERHNAARRARGIRPLTIVYDCPYEAYVPEGARPRHLALLAPGGAVVHVSGPGKTYGMHGDRLGYAYASAEVVDALARVQVNTTSFASVYAQVAGARAFREDMDAVSARRARDVRAATERVAERLARVDGLGVRVPDGAYFLFVDLGALAAAYGAAGHDSAAAFLLEEAGVMTIDGRAFDRTRPQLAHMVRINCGRAPAVLDDACDRIERAVGALRRVPVAAAAVEG